jgi:hypothetical protein
VTRLAACIGPLPDQPCHPAHNPNPWPVLAASALLWLWLGWQARPVKENPDD